MESTAVGQLLLGDPAAGPPQLGDVAVRRGRNDVQNPVAGLVTGQRDDGMPEVARVPLPGDPLPCHHCSMTCPADVPTMTWLTPSAVWNPASALTRPLKSPSLFWLTGPSSCHHSSVTVPPSVATATCSTCGP